jgi:hypothetical protein
MFSILSNLHLDGTIKLVAAAFALSFSLNSWQLGVVVPVETCVWELCPLNLRHFDFMFDGPSHFQQVNGRIVRSSRPRLPPSISYLLKLCDQISCSLSAI